MSINQDRMVCKTYCTVSDRHPEPLTLRYKPLAFLSILLILLLLFPACNDNSAPKRLLTGQNSSALFTKIEKEESGVIFNNILQESDQLNTYTYLNTYNGGGVAIGDINNDGLPDIYFTGNLEKNKLYLNKGNMRFEDITKTAKVSSEADWCTGVTMADVNNDGFLDIYINRAFSKLAKKSANLLYINNGDLTFTESGKAYGIADKSWSTQSTFFDYDLDGDLDLYVGNHLKKNVLDHEYSYQNFTKPTHELSDHLYKNNGDGTFSEVTKEAGILNYSVTLGVIAGDINKDGYPDIYIANDQQEPDFYYLNNGDGTFKNAIHESFRHTSFNSMGADLADFNNDGNLDLIVCDMTAQDNYRQKTQMASMNPAYFWQLVKDKYHYQYMRNVLQVNNGDGTFSEIGQMAGVSTTDWSWATFFADFDNDGFKDLIFTNGVKRDILDKDFMKNINHQLKDGYYEGNIQDLLNKIPSTPIANKFYKNNGDLTFSDQSLKAGIQDLGFSNGASYADLDLDGDLDLVINNMNAVASIYRNNSENNINNNYLRIQLKGNPKNPFALGAKVTIKIQDNIQFQEMTLTRGFKSSVESVIHFGTANENKVDQILVEWPNGNQSILQNIACNQVLKIDINESKKRSAAISTPKNNMPFQEVTTSSGVDFKHSENEYDDYANEILLPYKNSQFGPKLAVGDVDTNGLEDFFVGGASGQSGVLYLQRSDGEFEKTIGPWQKDKLQEDLDALFFDADNDGDQDLYVVSGGNEFPINSPLLQDRLYINQGKGHFIKNMGALPKMLSSGGCVAAADYDKDGDLDLFVGGRLLPGKYPFAPRSFLLNNEKGKFTDATTASGNDLEKPGLVNAILWTDFDQDEDLDLLLVGEWMPIKFMENRGGKFFDQTKSNGFENTSGWWNTIIEEDFDGDGDPDYVAGNLGLNTKYQASETEPFHIYAHDFDYNETLDIVLGYYNEGICYPVRGRQCSSEQMPNIQAKFPTYDQFAKASINEIYGAKELAQALHYEAKLFASSYIENKGGGVFEIRPLPTQAQISPIQALSSHDFNSDGHKDILLSGNLHVMEVETGRADAGNGLLLLGDGKGEFKVAGVSKTGFSASKDVRDMAILNGKTRFVLVTNNDAELQVFKHEEGK